MCALYKFSTGMRLGGASATASTVQFGSFQDGIYALGEALVRSALPPQSTYFETGSSCGIRNGHVLQPLLNHTGVVQEIF